MFIWILKRIYMILWILGAVAGTLAGITCFQYGITMESKIYSTVGLGLIILVGVSFVDKIIIIKRGNQRQLLLKRTKGDDADSYIPITVRRIIQKLKNTKEWAKTQSFNWGDYCEGIDIALKELKALEGRIKTEIECIETQEFDYPPFEVADTLREILGEDSE